MGSLKVLAPWTQDVTNLVTNASCELGAVTNWATAFGGVGISATGGRRGSRSAVWASSSSVSGYAYYTMTGLNPGSGYVVSLDIGEVNGVPMVFGVASSVSPLTSVASTTWTPDYTSTRSDGWVRKAVRFTASASTMYFYVGKNNSATLVSAKLDGLMCISTFMSGSIPDYMALGADYIDGDQPGCYWTGVPHASTSVARQYTRETGYWVDITDDLKLDDANVITVDGVSGVGLPPTSNHLVDRAILHGADFQDQRYAPRAIQANLTFNVSTRANLAALRASLAILLRLDSLDDQAPIRMRYAAYSTPLEFRALYESGLEFNYVAGETGFNESVTLRMVAPDPFFYEDGEDAVITSPGRSTTGSLNYFQKRSYTSGLWDVASGPNGRVIDILELPDGRIVFAGMFTSWSVGSSQGVVMYTPSTNTFSALGTGLAGNGYALALSADGNTLYVGGDFTSAGGVGSTADIAQYNLTTGVWSAMGTGLTGGNAVWSILAAPNGLVYAGGGFSQMGGVANTSGIAVWNGTAWSAMGTGAAGLGGVYSIVYGPDGNIYIGGLFSGLGGVSGTLNIGRWSTTDSVYEPIAPAGVNERVHCLGFMEDGTLFAGGPFTSVDLVSCAGMVTWNGSVWAPLGIGVTAGAGTDGPWVKGFNVIDGQLWVTGSMTEVDGISLGGTGLAIWNGSAWIAPDFEHPSGTIISGRVLKSKEGTIYFGHNVTGTLTYSRVLSLAALSLGPSYPKLKFTGPGNLKGVSSIKDNRGIWFDYTLLSGEVAVLDLDPEKMSFVSNRFGNVMSRILAGSDFDVLVLGGYGLRGGITERYNAFIGGSLAGSSSIEVTWRPRHITADSGALF